MSGPIGGPRFGVTDTEISHYVLVDLQRRTSRILLNAPVIGAPRRILWAPDSGSVLISEILLPINEQIAGEPATRTTVEVNVKTGGIAEVGRRCDEALTWTLKDKGEEL